MTERAHAALPFTHLREKVATALADTETRVKNAARAIVSAKARPLPLPLQAEHKTMRTHHGVTISYYADHTGAGRPIVLVHSVNACASAFETRPLFEHYRGKRPVYAVELAGFGSSTRDDRPYTPELYADELVELLARVKDKDRTAADVVAMSLSCEFVARAAAARKDLVHSLAFLSPTGLEAKGDGHGKDLAMARGLAGHWWSPVVYAAIATRPSIHYFLKKSFVGRVDRKLEDYAYLTSHQPGAEYAPLAFLAGKLFTPGIYDTYAALERPVLAIYDRDAYTRFDRLEELTKTTHRWTARKVAPSRGLPHFERLEETAAALDAFWGSHPQEH